MRRRLAVLMDLEMLRAWSLDCNDLVSFFHAFLAVRSFFSIVMRDIGERERIERKKKKKKREYGFSRQS